MKPLYKGLIVFLVLVLGGVLLWDQYANKVKREAPMPTSYERINKFEKEGVPDFEAVKTNGSSYKLSELKGKIIILSFWATWCAPCVEEFPSMMKMLEKYPNDIVMVGVSADQNQKDVDEFVGMFGGQGLKNFVSLWDPSLRVAEMYGTEKIPENYIIGRDFKLIRKLSSSQDWNSPEVLGYINSLLN